MLVLTNLALQSDNVSFCLNNFRKKLRTLLKIFTILPFPKIFFSIFIRQNFLRPFFKSFTTNFPLCFPVSIHFPLYREIFLFPLLSQISPLIFVKFTCFLHTLRVFRLPLLLP